ncbi:hypothetical protein [Fictibacillus fluitans]|uniref:Uncharacterized protein n=1 Tax=Fictibacillus fluitans TaxID=3058422 RepID=A0ABT8I0A5_9BACL|nr:hypothetical protein [Fictibacillus sp. NE201]MDN4526403.1 hypothetical protein [Fictibacillus sp. NE201]
MNEIGIEAKLLELTNEQYIKSNVTWTFKANSSTISVSYLKKERKYKIVEHDSGIIKYYIDLEEALEDLKKLK